VGGGNDLVEVCERKGLVGGNPAEGGGRGKTGGCNRKVMGWVVSGKGSQRCLVGGG